MNDLKVGDLVYSETGRALWGGPRRTGIITKIERLEESTRYIATVFQFEGGHNLTWDVRSLRKVEERGT